MTEIKVTSSKLISDLQNIFTDTHYGFEYVSSRKDILDNADRNLLSSTESIKIRCMKTHQNESNATYSDYGTAFAGKERCTIFNVKIFHRFNCYSNFEIGNLVCTDKPIQLLSIYNTDSGIFLNEQKEFVNNQDPATRERVLMSIDRYMNRFKTKEEIKFNYPDEVSDYIKDYVIMR